MQGQVFKLLYMISIQQFKISFYKNIIIFTKSLYFNYVKNQIQNA